MTAAYTDDPTIVQEQKQEKGTVVSPTNSPSSNKDRAAQNEIEKGTERSMIISGDSTGGQDKEEINQDQEKSTIISATIGSTSSSEQQEEKDHSEQEILEDLEVLENSQTSQTNLPETTLYDDLIIESKLGEVVDHDINMPMKSVIRDTSPEIQEDIAEENCRNFASSTCATNSSSPRSTNLKSVEESEDTSRMQLNELRYLLENVVAESKNHSADKYEFRKTYEVEENSISRDGVEEIYDPESELDFHEAVRAGDAKCVAALLTSGSVQNLDEPDWNVSGDPPLLVAATNHCLPVLSLLLANGCDPAVRSPRGETALHRVILNGGPGNVLKFVGELLKYGCPPGVKEAGGGLTALHVLTRQLAHAQGSKNLHHNFDTAIKTLELLAQAGPINAKDHQGRSALHILTSSTIFDNNHRTEIESLIETLLAAGADPSLKNDRGETPLHECLECGALNTAFLLIPHTPTGITSRYGETPLHIASRKNYVDMVAKLLEHGEDPSVQDAGGNTPLHLASARGFHQTVSLLVTSPLAQLEKLNIEGLTALQVAAESGFINAVRLLLKAGADPSQTIHYCTTTLHRHPDISVLIDHELTRRRQLAA